MRSVSPGTSWMSSSVGKLLLGQILKRENYFSQSFYLCEDILGVHLQAPEYDYNNQGHLSILIRKNPLTLIKKSEMITPVAILFSPSPLSQLPILIDIIDSKKHFLRRKDFRLF